MNAEVRQETAKKPTALSILQEILDLESVAKRRVSSGVDMTPNFYVWVCVCIYIGARPCSRVSSIWEGRQSNNKLNGGQNKKVVSGVAPGHEPHEPETIVEKNTGTCAFFLFGTDETHPANLAGNIE